MRKELQNELTAKVSLDLIRGQPTKRRMRPVRIVKAFDVFKDRSK